MKTQYATMAGNICLDKSLPNEETGKGTPISYEIWQVYNGSFFPGHNSSDKQLRTGFKELDRAQIELCRIFEVEMNERGYYFHQQGQSDFYAMPDEITNNGESGWYQNQVEEISDYPECDYPKSVYRWVEKQMTGYNYDNYAVVITTSNRDIVSL